MDTRDPCKQVVKFDMESDSQDQRTQPTEVNIVEFDVENGHKDLDLNKKYDDDESSSMSSNALNTNIWNRAAIISAGIAIFGILAGTLFLSYGIAASNTSQERSFRLVADETANEFELAAEDYVTAAKWLHQACAYHPINRTDFRDIYEHASFDLTFQTAAWVPRVYNDERAALEDSSLEYYGENYPDVNYRGIVGYEPDENSISGTSVQNRTEQPFYYPVHFIEPVETNTEVIDLDLYSIVRVAVDQALETFLPSATAPFVSSRDPITEITENSILLLHPGIPLSSHPDRKPEDLAALRIQVKDWLQHASRNIPESIAVYIYDITSSETEPIFVIAAEVHKNGTGDLDTNIILLKELTLEELDADNLLYQDSIIRTGSREWKVRAVALDGTFEPVILTVLVASIFILVASVFMALWVFAGMRRNLNMNRLKRDNDAEKAALVLKSAREATKMEQELNDYIAHEVRNPLSAALSALTFVKSEIGEKTSVKTKEITDDIQIVDSSLRFINDLLRSMLDFHRAKSKNMKLQIEPFDLEQDLLLPVRAMIYTRDSDVKIETNCPPGVVLKTDPIRMKQVVLNLCRNAVKFVHKGYVRIGATVENGLVVITVEDSGPGIPVDKRQHLFSKFQESLDALNQGTGIGLCLCRNMVDLLGGDIYLDESFESGIEGCPGARFVINTKLAPMTREEIEQYVNSKDDQVSTSLKFILDDELMASQDIDKDQELPEELSVLFVDDDLVLRKLFSRSVRKVSKTWNIKDASSGEAALELVAEQNFDLIFVDQYMASVEKQLLGTETARALRAKGIKSIICGLSANDVEAGFFSAGADFFMFKPFPCRPEELKQELLRILYTRRKESLAEMSTTSQLEC
ncbi:unnamed protein product [Cylindrotheca closterium]|uniref:Histidine kinase n=1 Tax=Cylindrotheca closterium TaxID=2856 RepID=A0AAD2FW62_9STRA|nr:unnamed protein product [Cylindrotheca closterium]